MEFERFFENVTSCFHGTNLYSPGLNYMSHF